MKPVLMIWLLLLAVEARSANVRTLFDRYCRPYADVRDVVVVRAEVAALDEASKTRLLDTARRQGGGDDRDMRDCAWSLLAAVQDRRVLPILLEFIADATRDPSDRYVACMDTWEFPANDSLSTMLGVLAEPGGLGSSAIVGLRKCAIKTLGETDDDSVRRRLRELLADPAYEWLDLNIIEALGHTRDAAAVPQLLAIATAPGVEPENYAAAEALAAIGTREGVAPLVGLMQRLPAGLRRYDEGISIAHALDGAIERTQDAELRAELVRVNEAVRALASDIPRTKPPQK